MGDQPLKPAGMADILLRVFDKLVAIEGRVSVLEERTCAHESRLEDLETWQDKVDDKLEAS